MLHHLHCSYISYTVYIDYLLVFKGPSQEDQVLCEQGRGVQSYPRLEPKQPAVSPLHCGGLDTASEREGTLLPVNTHVYVELPGF